MNLPPNANEPAFPMAPVGTGDPRDGMTNGHLGLSKREEFAKAAMQGLLASEVSRPTTTLSEPWLAGKAVRCADALLAELAKKGEGE